MQTAAVLNVMIQGDFVPMRAEQQGLGGISECVDAYSHCSVFAKFTPALSTPSRGVRAVGFHL